MNLKPLNILLADDDMDDCIFFKDALGDLLQSTYLSIVNDGEKLMQLLNNEENELPDVVFLDINMPRKNGFECLSEIKHNERLKNLPVIMFSTSNSQEKISKLFNSGAHVYIHKPADFEQLKQVIRHALPMATEEIFTRGKIKYILNA